MFQVHILALIYVIGVFNLFAVTEYGSEAPISACDEALLPPEVRLLNRALAEGVVSRESLRAWLAGGAETPQLVKSWSSSQFPVVQGLERLLATQPLKKNRSAIESWLGVAAGQKVVQEKARKTTVQLLNPKEILSFPALADTQYTPILETAANGELRFAAVEGSTARVYRWSLEEQQNGIQIKRPEKHSLSPGHGKMSAWDYFFAADGRLKAYALEDQDAIFVEFNGKESKTTGLGFHTDIRGSPLRMLNEEWAGLSGNNDSHVFSIEKTRPAVKLYETPRRGHIWTNADGKTILFGTLKPGQLVRYELVDGVWNYQTFSYYNRSFEVIRDSNGRAIVVQIDALDQTNLKFVIRFRSEDGTDLAPPAPIREPGFEDPVMTWDKDGRLLVAVLTVGQDPQRPSVQSSTPNQISVYAPLESSRPYIENYRPVLASFAAPKLKWIEGLRREPVIAIESGATLSFLEASNQPVVLARVDFGKEDSGHVLHSNDGRYFAWVESKIEKLNIRLFQTFNGSGK